MRIQRTSQVITGAIIVLSLFAIACAFISRHYRDVQEQAYETRRKMFNYAEQLARGSDRLTATVRAYAATGDRRHYDDFQRELKVDRQRDRAIEGLQELGLSDDELELFASAKRNSDHLVEIENKAFDAVARKDVPGAIQIVYGPEFTAVKESIMGPIAQCRRILEQRLTAKAKELSNRAETLALIAIGALILNAAAIVVALLFFYQRRVVKPLARLNRSLRDLAARKEGARIGYQEEDSELGEVARSMESYRSSVDAAECERWVKTSSAEVAECLQGAEQTGEFGKRLLSSLVPLLGGGCGAFHLLDESDGRFHFASGYGLDEPKNHKGFAPGEGVPGQAVVERKTIVLSDLPDGYVRINSGLGEAPPRVLAVVPIKTRRGVTAVIEVASFTALSDQQRALLEEVAGMVALQLEVLQRNLRGRELLALQQALIESIPYPMFVKDAQGRFTGCNKAYEREFGAKSDLLKGKTVLEMDYLPESERQKFHNEDMSVIREGSRRSYELPIEYADGRTHTTLYSVDGFKLPDGSPGGLIGLLVDISDQKRVAEELRVAKGKAEEATEMKSMFLANMSHEIRTPMNAIIGLSYLALKTQLTPKQRDYVSKVHNAGTSLLAIINDILDFSKIEAGKLDLESTDFRLDEVISSVTTLTAQKAHEKGLEFLAHVVPGVPEQLLGDPLRLGQILTNFVNNAVKFTEHGEIRLEIEQLERTGEKVQLKFSVRDSGIGMTSEQSARLFQPFTQADMSTTRKHGGTGLGLTICRRLVELMGGRIWLESEPGVGSTFYFTAWLGVGSNKGAARIIPSKLSQLRVLVVDDNSAAREILEEPLSTIARKVDTVASGKDALEAIKRQDASEPYDIVFMDWRMSGMDGLQASRQIKCDETLTQQPAIVLVTAFGREEVREEAERLQLDGFLVKPVTKSMIVDTLVNVFSEQSDSAEPEVEGEQIARLRGARILLAEDNEINQQIAIELLEGVGASVTVANNGRQAFEILSASAQPAPFDVILMDLQMPEMDGYQTTAKLRSDNRFAALPIIAMTAHATIEERQRCLAAGMNDHVAKPIDPGNLFETVGRFYKVAETQTSSAKPSRSAIDSTPQLGELPEIEGLDTKGGLARVAGNRSLYVKLLRQFVEQQGSAADDVTTALSNNDIVLAERIAHTLKGVAGNIGAKTVQAAANSLEKAIRDRAEAPVVESAKRSLAEIMTAVMEKLRVALNVLAPEVTPKLVEASPVNAEHVREVAAELARLLADSDPGAVEFIEKNPEVADALFGVEGHAQFKTRVENYAFADAESQLEQARKAFASS